LFAIFGIVPNNATSLKLPVSGIIPTIWHNPDKGLIFGDNADKKV